MGTIREVDVSLIETILEDDYIPVIASVGCGPDGFYNINADVAAGKVAEAMHADKLIYLTDVDGLYRDRNDPETLIAQLTKSETQELLESQTLDGGMIPKIQSIYDALDAATSGLVRFLATDHYVSAPGTGSADETIQRAVNAAK